MGYFRILAAIPGFFLSSLLLMWLWGPIAQHFGMPPIDYPYSMLVTVTLPCASISSVSLNVP
ncbi:MAG: hypothetical protein ABSG90_05520 [Dehalococcoidia bacterium]